MQRGTYCDLRFLRPPHQKFNGKIYPYMLCTVVINIVNCSTILKYYYSLRSINLRNWCQLFYYSQWAFWTTVINYSNCAQLAGARLAICQRSIFTIHASVNA